MIKAGHPRDQLSAQLESIVEYILPFCWWLLTSNDLQANMTMLCMITFTCLPAGYLLLAIAERKYPC